MLVWAAHASSPLSWLCEHTTKQTLIRGSRQTHSCTVDA